MSFIKQHGLSSNHHHLKVSEGKSDKLFIFFSAMSMSNGRFSFWKVGESIKDNVLFLSDGDRDWYQLGIKSFGSTLDDTIDSIADLQKELGIKDTFSIGFSMGAYGAVLLAAKMNFNCLCLGGETLLKIKGTRSKRWMPSTTKLIEKDLRPLIKQSSAFFHIVVGECESIDTYSAMRVNDLPNTNVVILKGVNHFLAQFLTKANFLADYIDCLGSYKPLPKTGFESEFSEDGYFTELLLKSQLFKNKDLNRAKKYADEACSIQPLSSAGHYERGLIADAEKDWTQAIKSFSMASFLAPHMVSAKLRAAKALRFSGQRIAAENAYQEVLKLNPDSSLSYYWLGRLWVERGMFDEGVDYIHKAIILAPENAAFGRYLSKITVKSKLPQSNDYILSNDASSSKVGILWVKPWGGIDSLNSYSKVRILSVNTESSFNGLKAGLIPFTTVNIENITIAKKTGWIKIQLVERIPIAKDSVRFQMVSDAMPVS